MITMFRLNQTEAEKVRKTAIEVNKKRIENGIEPVKDRCVGKPYAGRMARHIAMPVVGFCA